MNARLSLHQFREALQMWNFTFNNGAGRKFHNHYIPVRINNKMNNIPVDFVWIVGFFLVLLSCCHEGRGEVIGYGCSKVKSSNNSLYLTNRRILFLQLESMAVRKNFSSAFSQSGDPGPNRIFGFVQCHGSSEDNCYSCILNVKDFIVKFCGNAENGYMWMDDCFLRYGKKNITSVVDNSRSLNCRANYSGPQPQIFATVVNMTLGKLKNSTNGKTLPEVLSRWNSSKNGSDSGARRDDFAAYGKAQCYLPLSQTDCGRCIENRKSYVQNSPALQYCSALEVWSESCFSKYWVSSSDANMGHGQPRRSGSLDDNEQYGLDNNGKYGNASSPLTVPSAPLITPPVHPVSTDNQQKSNSRILWSIVGALLVSILLLFSLVLILVKNNMLSWRWRWKWRTLQNDSIREITGIRIYSYELLRYATGNFDETKKLGEGGYGSVYQGILPDGDLVALKRLNVNSKHANDQFLNEANCISTVQHRNLVKLLGCCAEGSEKLLVYEYLPNKSLDKILFRAELSPLDWSRRKSIILGVARGLAYLHEESQPRIVHRDIKAGNILLDDNYNAKISDFGLARLFPQFGSHVSTRVAGTFGYLAPEYAVRGQLTEKADIFSFGVLFLELISGRQNLDITASPQRHFLLEWAWKLYELGDLWGIVDPKIDANYSREDIERSIEIAFLCVQGTAQLRPSMSQVVGMLTSEQPIHMYPQKPALLDLSFRDRDKGHDSGGSSGSTHNVATSFGGAASSSVLSDIYSLQPR